MLIDQKRYSVSFGVMALYCKYLLGYRYLRNISIIYIPQRKLIQPKKLITITLQKRFMHFIQ